MTGLDPNRPFDPPFVPWAFDEHDDAVRELVRIGHLWATAHHLDMGVACIDFADGTVVVLSAAIPAGETFTHGRRDENHILAGFAPSHPFATEDPLEQLMDGMTEVPNPDAPKHFGVNGTRPTDG